MSQRQINIILGENERLVEEPGHIGMGRLFRSNLSLLIFDPGDWIFIIDNFIPEERLYPGKYRMNKIVEAIYTAAHPINISSNMRNNTKLWEITHL